MYVWVTVGGITGEAVKLGTGVTVEGLPVNEKLHQVPLSRNIAPDGFTATISQ